MKLALVLGSGAARGWAHIGVIRELDALGIRPDMVAGCSMGAIVGAAWALDRLDALEAFALGLDWQGMLKLADPGFLSGGGLLRGEKLTAFFRAAGADMDMKDLPRPFATLATDLATGREVWLRDGSLVGAVRASIAMPGHFAPAPHDGHWLVDGGLVNPVPVSLARAMGADRVIAVNLNDDLMGEAGALPSLDGRWAELREGLLERLDGLLPERLAPRARGLVERLVSDATAPAGPGGPPGLLEVLWGSINVMQDHITRSRAAGDPPDLMLCPRLGPIQTPDFDRAALAIARGRDAVREQAAALLRLCNKPAPQANA